MSGRNIEMEHRVTPLELFFDLVFVFAFTQVTALLLENESWIGLARGLLVLGVLWWAWASYAWLTNAVDADAGLVIAAVLAAMAAMFVAALAVPDAFGRHRVVFAVAFLIVLVMYLALFALAVKGEPDLLAAVLRNARPSMVGAALILVAAFVAGGIRPLLWLAALAVGLFGGLFSSLSGWRVHPAHFAERHGLIVIIALDESLGAIGFGARDTGLTLAVIVAAVLGLAIAASFWLAYFDFAAVGAQRLLADRSGERQIAFARDVYSYLHLPMVAGIVLFAFAMRRTLADVHAELHWIPALALCGGCALYVFAYVLLRLRVSRSVGRGRAAATVAFMLLLPVTVVVPGLAALALVVAVWVALHAYELIWWREARAETRALRTPASTA